MMKKILFIDNTAHHMYSQQHLYSAFVKLGYWVILCCPDDNNYFRRLQQEGYQCVNFAIDGKSMSLIKNLALFWYLYRLLKGYMPDIIFSFTIKPNIYSSLAGRFLNIPVVPNITGLGYVFLKSSLIKYIVIRLYKFAFANLNYVVFQNKDDKQVFLDHKILSAKTEIIQVPGSGVNLTKFSYVGYTNMGNITFLYIGRLLLDKGIKELIDAFRIISKKYPTTKLKFIGNYFLGNPSAISSRQMELWQNELPIEYLGMVDNVADHISASSCVVLPSYREGMPRAVLEASSMGIPVITTDTVGCRDSVDDLATGFLCKVKDVRDLADKMEKFIEYPDKVQMGINGRAKMEREFDQQIVIDKYRLIVSQTLNPEM